jgi:5-methyltetrahydropteroyltriglutamate--homocysteine methyltransferase
VSGAFIRTPVSGAVIRTSLVGSYPQPDWLIDREALAQRLPPRLRARELWRIDSRWLREAQDDAVALAVRDQERAGLDVITDGEIRRESYSNHFANALEGINLEHPGTIRSRAGTAAPVPRVTGPIVRREPVHVADLDFLRSQTDRPVKVTVPGPFTMSQQAQNDFYEHEEALALAYADVVREELDDLFAAGADVVQLDEPWMEARPEAARRLALPALERALDGVPGTTAVHVCFGYPAFVPDHPLAYSFLTELAGSSIDQISIEAAQSGVQLSVLEQLQGKTIILGVVALDSSEVESSEQVAGQLRRALAHMPADQLMAAPDCGMKYLSRDVAFAKLQAMVAGARQATAEVPRDPAD